MTWAALTACSASSLPALAKAPSEVTVEPQLRLPDPPTDKREVALTLDACSGGFDERIMRLLIDERIPATVFVTRRWLRRNPVGLATLLAHRDLFEIENHGAQHIPAILGAHALFGMQVAGDLAGVRREVGEGAEAITAATGRKPRWYRGAGARYSPDAIAAIEAMGFAIAGFSLNADMGASLPARTVAARIAQARNGDVIIAHVNHPLHSSGLGVAEGVRALKREGVTFVRLDQPASAGQAVTRLESPRSASPASP